MEELSARDAWTRGASVSSCVGRGHPLAGGHHLGALPFRFRVTASRTPSSTPATARMRRLAWAWSAYGGGGGAGRWPHAPRDAWPSKPRRPRKPGLRRERNQPSRGAAEANGGSRTRTEACLATSGRPRPAAVLGAGASQDPSPGAAGISLRKQHDVRPARAVLADDADNFGKVGACWGPAATGTPPVRDRSPRRNTGSRSRLGGRGRRRQPSSPR